LWAARAAMAERAVWVRHLRTLWGIPGTRLGVTGWPWQFTWHYWWQAHLLDCMVDAQLRSPVPERRRDIERLLKTIKLRNRGRWLNRYYDDIAWLGLALWRCGEELEIRRPEAIGQIAQRLRDGWSDHGGGGIWWRTKDNLKNVSANGPAAILFTRLGDRVDLQRSLSIVDWIEEWLIDPDTGLVLDGLRVDPDGEVTGVVEWAFTYCQGVFIGACVELFLATGNQMWAQLARRTVLAVVDNMVGDVGVLPGNGGGDGGLFAGILARYLAQAAIVLGDKEAAQLVYLSADAAWRNQRTARGGPLFGPEWIAPTVRRHGTRDLSVQLSGWMLFEAAALLESKEVLPYALS
jgi:predicted alpha-1,6-mannanase (GH76 family)